MRVALQTHVIRHWIRTIAPALLCIAVVTARGEDLTLRYNKPAHEWSEALPLGNGFLGAMIFGGTTDERVQINEGTLWGGQPHDYANSVALSKLAEIRRLIFAGKIVEAEALSASVMGDPKSLTPFQPFVDLRLHFLDQGQVTSYERSLQLDDAVHTVSYISKGVRYRRETFVSYPDRVLVMCLTADRPASQNFAVELSSPQPGARVAVIQNNRLELTGTIEPRSNPEKSWTASWSGPGLSYAGALVVKTDGGEVLKDQNRLIVRGADAVTLIFSGATSYRSYRDISGSPQTVAKLVLDSAQSRSFADLERAHLADYQVLFGRMHLRLGPDTPADMRTTDERLRSFKVAGDPSLAALYYQYGRYLLIACSRAGGQPANLQGLWNQDLLPMWGSKWTTNINLQMNYWPAEAGALWETEMPLWDLVGDLQVAGAVTAKLHYGARGWVLHHNSDLWRGTAPVDGAWGLWPMGGVWLANQMWDHYEFSEDEDFLKRRAYPAMKGAAEFLLDFLTEAPAGSPVVGKLVTVPSTSPENRYLVDGKAVSLTYAPAMDIELMNDLFHNVREASQQLNVDAPLRARIEAAQRRLPQLQIGHKGQLQEWIEDYPENDPKHRHVSPLYGLYPGEMIVPDKTPALAAAARRTLELRGDEGTGWSKAWKAALWARLQDGDHAYAMLRSLLTENTLPNMFDLCPPFQMDGNFGGAAAIAEMLLQSRPGEITLLPALPSAWPDGEVDGLRARGNLQVGMHWKDGVLAEFHVISSQTTSLKVSYHGNSRTLALAAGKTVSISVGQFFQ